MSNVIKFDASDRFGDVDALSRDMFDKVDPSFDSEGADPPIVEAPPAPEPVTPPVAVAPKRKSHGGLTRYVNVPDADLLQCEPQVYHEETTMAAIRSVMVDQKRDFSRKVLPALDPIDTPDPDDGPMNSTPSVAEQEPLGQGQTPPPDRGDHGITRGLLGKMPWVLLFLSIPMAPLYLQIAAFSVLGSLSILALLRGIELVIEEVLDEFRAFFSRFTVGGFDLRRLAPSFTSRSVDGPLRAGVARMVGDKPKVSIEQVLSDMGYERHEMTLELAERVAKELRRMGWKRGGRETHRPGLSLGRRLISAAAA